MYRQAAGTMGRVLLAYAGIGAIGCGIGGTLINTFDELNLECYDNEKCDVLCYSNVNIEKERQTRIATFSKDDPLKIHFNAYQRNFGLVLNPISPEKSPFHRDLSIIEDGVPLEMNPHHFIYEGHVEGDKNSRVYGSVLDGLFDGQICLSDGSTFTVEKKSKYNNLPEHSSSFHSRIIQGSLIEVNTLEEEGYFKMEDRIPTLFTQDRMMRTFTMHLKVDHKLYKEMYKKEGNYCRNRTREEIISMFYNHMRTVNDIYESARLDGMPDINFSVQKISIETRPMSYSEQGQFYSTDLEDLNAAISESNLVYSQIFTEWLVAFILWCLTYRHSKSIKYIVYLLLKDHSDFDLSYAFTFQKFECDIIGLSVEKGIQKDSSNINVGVVTLRDEGGRLDAREVQWTLAHEIGHSLGAEHMMIMFLRVRLSVQQAINPADFKRFR